MERYLKLDGYGKVTTCDVLQNAEGTLIKKDITDEQMKDIFYYSLVGGKLVLSPQKEINDTKKQLGDTDAKMPRALEDIIDVLITKNTFRKIDLPIAVQELYDLKKELRSRVIK